MTAITLIYFCKATFESKYFWMNVSNSSMSRDELRLDIDDIVRKVGRSKINKRTS